MAEEIFVDASAWVALADENDNRHAEAAQIYSHVLTHYQRLVTTNLVVAEAYVIIRHGLGITAAIELVETVNSSLRVRYIHSNEALEVQALAILRQYDDQDFSYADAVSFAVMKQRGILDAFAYDRHFRAMGFRMVG